MAVSAVHRYTEHTQEASKKDEGMEQRLLGKTGMQVSRVGFGSYKMSNKPGGTTVKEVERLLGSLLDQGVNVIDTAECYGQSEELLGQALASRRAEVCLFTKCGHAAGLDLPDWSPCLLEQSIERSLRRLRTDHLDVVHLHSCSLEQLRRGEVLAVLQRVRAAGKTGCIGYSGDGRAALFAVTSGIFDVLQTSVNIADQEALTLTLPHAKAHGMGIIAKRSLANTAWMSKHDAHDSAVEEYARRLAHLNYPFLRGTPDQAISTALRFTVSVPEVDIALVGSTHLAHWQYTLALVAQGPLPVAEYTAIRTRWQQVTDWQTLLPRRLRWHGSV